MAGTHPVFAGIVLVDGQRADGLGCLLIEDRLPVDPAAGRFPDAARGRTGIDDIWFIQHHIDGGHAAAHTGGPDVANFQPLELLDVDLLPEGHAREEE